MIQFGARDGNLRETYYAVARAITQYSKFQNGRLAPKFDNNRQIPAKWTTYRRKFAKCRVDREALRAWAPTQLENLSLPRKCTFSIDDMMM